MNRLIPTLVSLALVSGIAYATETPKPMAYDSRIRSVVYNPDNVVEIVGTYGISTHIIFSPSETIQHVALGDSLAWEVAPIGNNLWLKPTEPNAYTNLSIVTNRRSYEFELIAKPKSSSTAGLYYMVQFQYPQDVAAARAAADAAKLIEQHQQRKTNTVNMALQKAEAPVRKNIDYWVRGAAGASPDEAFDDGTFTYFRFKGNREFPAVFLETIGPDDKKIESLVNTTIKGDTIVVQRLASHFILRKGAEVAEIVNKDYNPVGTPTGTGTISTRVKRVVNGDIDPHPPILPIHPAATPPSPIDYSPAGDDSVPIHSKNVLPPPRAEITPPVQKQTASVQVFRPDESAPTAPTVPDATAADVAAAQTHPVPTLESQPTTVVPAIKKVYTPVPAAVASVLVVDPANIRALPTQQSDRIGFAKPGNQFQVLGVGKDPRWYHIKLSDDQSGWITTYAVHYMDDVAPPTSNDDLPSVPAAVPPQPITRVTLPPSAHVVVTHTATIRSQASPLALTVEQAHPGDNYAVMGSANDRSWYRILVDGRGPAWIAASAVHYLPPGTSPAGIDADGATP